MCNLSIRIATDISGYLPVMDFSNMMVILLLLINPIFFRTDLLTNNNVFCVAEDAKHRLLDWYLQWSECFGQENGCDTENRSSEMNGNSIPQVLITSDERILFATDWGVYEYQEDKDDFLCHGGENTGNVMPRTAIKSLFEDDRGDIWIGTWDAGVVSL